MAEGEGFEPPLPFRVKRFSRPPVSTAHTSLRVAGTHSLSVRTPCTKLVDRFAFSPYRLLCSAAFTPRCSAPSQRTKIGKRSLMIALRLERISDRCIRNPRILAWLFRQEKPLFAEPGGA